MSDFIVKPKTFPDQDCKCLLTGPSGNLETAISKAVTASNKVCIICHPNPLQEGTMDNKVVYIISKALQTVGFDTVRFNFRGIGQSEGVYGDLVGEMEDLKAVIAWLRSTRPNAEIHLAGFSFGSYISAEVAAHDDSICSLISVAPPVDRYPFDCLPKMHCPWLVIQGSEDEVVPTAEVTDWARDLVPNIQYRLLEDTGHFFHGRLVDLRKIIENNYS